LLYNAHTAGSVGLGGGGCCGAAGLYGDDGEVSERSLYSAITGIDIRAGCGAATIHIKHITTQRL